ncbi:IEV morphogenesis protein [Equine molluscum contagiosum-like virus]|nr:IEV morphogenesis protein [Equine molluscum contagiosum-like virus]
MLAAQHLRDQFAALSHLRVPSTRLRRAFGRLPWSVAKELLAAGLHPRSVPAHWYCELAETAPEKLYLARPKDVDLQDLLVALERHSNAELYAAHIEYHKHSLLRTGDAFLLARCVPHMTLFDDDVRYLFECLPVDDAVDVLAHVNARSMYTMSYNFSEEVAEEMLQRPEIAEALYDHQCFHASFLRRMFFDHNVVPANAGIAEEADAQFAAEVLAGLQDARAAARFLAALDRRTLRSTAVRNAALTDIMNGHKLAHYLHYADPFLRDKVEAMHVYACIYFPETRVDLARHTLTRERLQNICAFIESYADQVELVARALLRAQHFDLLARIFERAPAALLTESVTLATIRAAAAPLRVRALRVRSQCVLLQCHARGYQDLVDFLDVFSVAQCVGYGVELLTDYCFRTDWFNRDEALLRLFVQRFGFCGAQMRRLLFEYPLTAEAAARVLDLMAEHPGMSLFEPQLMASLRYLLCTTGTLRIRPLRSFVTLARLPAPRDDLEREDFASETAYDLCVALQVYCFSRLRTCAVRELAYARTPSGVCLQYLRLPAPWQHEADRIAAQAQDLGRLARCGLFWPPVEYLPHWTPVFDLLAGGELRAPARVEGTALRALRAADFVRYADLGDVVTDLYALREVASPYHAALNTLMASLLAYLVLGAAWHLPADDAAPAFASALVRGLLRGLKINEVLTDTPPELHAELVRLRAAAAADSSGGVTIPEPAALRHALRLCEEVCAAIILENNQCNKFQA